MIPHGKIILCVFAHPDDESFGPGGTIATLAKDNTVFLLCVTDGNDPGKSENLTKIRQKELDKAAAILGIKEVFYLNYADGSLRNDIYHDVAKKIEDSITTIKPEILVTFELRGVSGHIDHMALSAITSYVFEKASSPQELWYYCESQEFLQKFPEYFIFTPSGYSRSTVDLIVDVTDVREVQLEAMRAHVSQKSDAELIIKCRKGLPAEEYFLVRKKS